MTSVSTGANEADPETYTGLSRAVSLTLVQKPVTWSKAALQVAVGVTCLTPGSDRHLALSVRPPTMRHTALMAQLS